jgi:hypothetical protein
MLGFAVALNLQRSNSDRLRGIAVRVHFSRYCLLLAFILASCAPNIPAPFDTVAPWPAPPLRQIAAASTGRPVAAGDYLFWHDRRGGGAIYGYRLSQRREFVVRRLGVAHSAASLASDGATLAWLETGDAPQHILAYDISTQYTYTLPVRSADGSIADLALHRGVLYYWDHTPARRGIFAYDLASGIERRISLLPRPTGQGRLAVADEVIVWSEYGASGASLAMRHLAAGAPERIVVQGQPWSGTIAGFGVTGDSIIWSFALEQQVWLYSISRGTRQVISVGAASRPIIKGSLASWNVRFSNQRRQSIAIYDLASRSLATLVDADAPYAETQAIDDAGNVIFTVDRRPALQQELYIASGTARALHVAESASADVPFRPPGQPLGPGSGQVRVKGKQLVLDAASRPWAVNGVQLILPSHGINGGSFSAATLDDPLATAERREWLERAEQIGVQTIRIYLDMPGDAHLVPAPRPEQIYAFARNELAPRGMRLALVIHNSGQFDDPDGRKMAWLRALLDRFGGLSSARAPGQGAGWHPPIDRTYLLAYINADNEINIHRHAVDAMIPGSPYCRPDDPTIPQIDEDCFDHPNPEQRRRYIQAALGWVALVRGTVKQHRTGQRVLVTAGMSVDLEKDILGDGRSAALNYFIRIAGEDGRRLPSLADLVDFIAPHSYTAQPYWEIVEPIERDQPFFAKPILLEEFGYPTDPIAQPDPQRPAEYKDTSLNLRMLADGSLRLVPNRQGLPAGEDVNKLCRYLPKLGSFGDSPKRCNPSAPYVVQMNLEAIFDLRYMAGGIAFMLADSNEKDDHRKQCYAAETQQQLSKNLFSGLFATNSSYRCGGTVNVGRGQIKNTGYRVCVAYRTGNPQLGDYTRRVPACEIDLGR